MKKTKLSSLALSLLIAFGLWLYVVNNVSQESEDTIYNIPVVIVDEAVLNERNLMITGVSSETISLTLSGARSDLSKVNNQNITVKMEVAGIYEPGEKIELKPKPSYPGDVPSNAFVVQSMSPASIFVSVDTRRTKEIPVRIQWTGTRAEGYIYDTENAVLDYPMISISGPAAVADMIDHASVEVDLTGQTESMSESFRYTLCDASGQPVDAKQITTNVEEVRLDMKVQQIKEIRLVADIIYGGGTSELNTIVTVEPEIIRVSGSEAILDEMGDTYTLGTINLADIEKSQDLKYTINIPEGVTNQSGVTEAVVNIRFSGLSIREFNVSDIQIVNLPAGLEAEIINSSLSVKVRGPASEISLLTVDDITAVVDFATASVGNATYKATLQFSEAFPNVGALKAYSVPATVRAAEED